MTGKLKLALVAASLLFVGSATAQPNDDGDGDRSSYKDKKDGKRGDRRAKRMAKFDLNKDGKIDAAERKAMFKVRFDRADKNKDGVLSFDEAESLMKRGGFGKRHHKQP